MKSSPGTVQTESQHTAETDNEAVQVGSLPSQNEKAATENNKTFPMHKVRSTKRTRKNAHVDLPPTKRPLSSRKAAKKAVSAIRELAYE